MIERYSRQVMRDVWSEEAKFQAWLDVEILIDEAWSKLGEIPAAISSSKYLAISTL